MLGGALFAIGAFFNVLGLVNGDGPRLFFGLPLVAGLVLFIRGWTLRAEADDEAAELSETSTEAPRASGILGRPELFHKVVGQACTTCGGKIVFIADGDLCGTCEGPIHRRCADQHALEHQATPYR